MKINKHIEIVCTTETGLSSMSRRSRDAILAVLNRKYTKTGISIVNNISDLEALVASKPDLVFLGMKFIPMHPNLGFQDPNKIWISQYLDEHNIAYTGSTQQAHELELNKPLAKQRALDSGLKTSPFYVAKQNQPLHKQSIPLEFPLFIKPTDRGGGMGIDSNSVVYDFEALQTKVQSITKHCQSDSLIEEYLPGREFSVAILKNQHSPGFSVMTIEKVASPDKNGRRVLSQHVKSSDSVRDKIVTDKIIKAKISALALDVFYALGARDYGRIDVRLDKRGNPQFLEANLIPSLISGYGSFPKACVLNMNLDYESMILNIVDLALARAMSADEKVPHLHRVYPSFKPAFNA